MSEIPGQSLGHLQETLNKVGGAFHNDEQLTRLLTPAYLFPVKLNTLNTVFNGPGNDLAEEDRKTLDQVIAKYIPDQIDKAHVLTTDGIKQLRKMVFMVNLASKLNDMKVVNLGETLIKADGLLSAGKLDPVISTEEMFRLRVFSPEGIEDTPATRELISLNPHLEIELAFDAYVRGIKEGKSPEDAASALGETYQGEHVDVKLISMGDGKFKPDYGLVLPPQK